MQCKDCRYYEKAYVHSVIGDKDFGMRYYGQGRCRRYGGAVWGSDEACGMPYCRSCARRKELFMKNEGLNEWLGEYIPTGRTVCMIRKADVSDRKRKCALYLPEKGDDAGGSADDADPKARRLIPDGLLLWLLGRSRRLRLRLRRLRKP